MAGASVFKTAAVLLGVANLASAQQPGTSTPEVHPALTTYKCTTSGGCVSQQTSVVLDWNYRWIHDSNYNSCTANGGVDPTLCPDAASCDKNCYIEGADYAGAGVKTSGDVLTMNQYVKVNGTYNGASPRIYLVGTDGNYEMLKLNGQELTFDVDLSTLPCGENGALYLSEMAANGGRTNGAEYGSGYCDAQCPVQTWLNGTLNVNKAPFCCNEMDILEANSRANAFTPHPCTTNDCDKGGCGFNPYNQGQTNYWAPGGTLDTSKPFTVTTKFITSDGTKSGSLVNITRVYTQNGAVVKSAVTTGDTIQASACPSAANYGGLKTMGEALGRGMVLALSIWNDASGYMNWLDSGSNGPCSATEGNPTNIVANQPDTHVVFSKIRWGDIGSTTGKGSTTGPSSITTVTTATSTAPGTGPTGCTAQKWSQCGGNGFQGCTQCASGTTCQVANDWYSQCL